MRSPFEKQLTKTHLSQNWRSMEVRRFVLVSSCSQTTFVTSRFISSKRISPIIVDHQCVAWFTDVLTFWLSCCRFITGEVPTVIGLLWSMNSWSVYSTWFACSSTGKGDYVELDRNTVFIDLSDNTWRISIWGSRALEPDKGIHDHLSVILWHWSNGRTTAQPYAILSINRHWGNNSASFASLDIGTSL